MTQREDLVCFANISISPVRAAYKIKAERVGDGTGGRQARQGLKSESRSWRVDWLDWLAVSSSESRSGSALGVFPLLAEDPSFPDFEAPELADFVLWRFFAFVLEAEEVAVADDVTLAAMLSAGVVLDFLMLVLGSSSPIGTFGFLSSQMMYWRFTASSIAECPTVLLMDAHPGRRRRPGRVGFPSRLFSSLFKTTTSKSWGEMSFL